MRRLVCSLVFVVLTLCGAVKQFDAVTAFQSKDFVTVELTVGKQKIFHRYKIPIVSNLKERKIIDDQFAGGTYGFTGSCPKDIGCEYTAIMIADAIEGNKFNIGLGLSFKDKSKCDVSKDFIVVRGKPTELKLKCNAKIKAYYDLQ